MANIVYSTSYTLHCYFVHHLHTDENFSIKKLRLLPCYAWSTPENICKLSFVLQPFTKSPKHHFFFFPQKFKRVVQQKKPQPNKNTRGKGKAKMTQKTPTMIKYVWHSTSKQTNDGGRGDGTGRDKKKLS